MGYKFGSSEICDSQDFQPDLHNQTKSKLNDWDPHMGPFLNPWAKSYHIQGCEWPLLKKEGLCIKTRKNTEKI